MASGISGGIKHFGFRLSDAATLDKRVTLHIERAGGKIKDRGEFVPGEPYVFFTDPDGTRWRSGRTAYVMPGR